MTKPRVARMDSKNVPRALGHDTSEDALVELAEKGVRQLARKASPEAVRVLRSMMVDKKVPANVRRQCALDLIELGHGNLRQTIGRSLSGAGMVGVQVKIERSEGQAMSIDLTKTKGPIFELEEEPDDGGGT